MTEIRVFLITLVASYLPPKPTSMKAKIVSVDTNNFFAGKANNERINLTFIINKKKVVFPINFVYHCNQKNVKTVIVLNFFDGVPNRYFPAEEIIDLGWNAVTVNYNDITSDKALIDGNGHYMSFPKDNNYKVLRGKEGKTAPNKAASAPAMPARCPPITIAVLAAIMPGTVVAMEIRFKSSSRVKRAFLPNTKASSITGSIARPPPMTKVAILAKVQNRIMQQRKRSKVLFISTRHFNLTPAIQLLQVASAQ